MSFLERNPITPSQVREKIEKRIPVDVFDIVNKLIVAKYVNGIATVYQEAIIKEIVATTSYTREQIFEGKFLDIETYYKNAGWDVVYNKPAYRENFEPYFVFKEKK